jgi:hypothetical protein
MLKDQEHYFIRMSFFVFLPKDIFQQKSLDVWLSANC